MSRPPDSHAYRYPPDWPAIAEEVRARAGDRCECQGECGNPFCTSGQDPDERCKVRESRHFPRHWVLALDHNPENSGHLGDRPNLRAFCASCCDSYRYDLKRAPSRPDSRTSRDPEEMVRLPIGHQPEQIGLGL